MLDRVTGAALPWVLAAASIACAALLVALVVTHVGRGIRGRHRNPQIESLRARVIELLSAETGEEIDALYAELLELRGWQWDVTVDEAFRMIPKFEGVAVTRLTALLAEAGVMDARIAELSSGRPHARAAAARDLGNARWFPAAGPVSELLRYHHPGVRNVAVRALGQIGDPVSVDAVLRAVGEGHVHSGPAIETLEAMGRSEGVADRVLAAMHVPVPDVRCVAVAVAGNGRMTKALPALHTLVVVDEDRDVRRLAALALGQIGDDSSVRSLVAATTADPSLSVALAAITALGEIASDEAIDVLRSFAQSDDAAVNLAAANVIAGIPHFGLPVLRELRQVAPQNVAVAAAFQRCLLASGVAEPEADPQWVMCA